MLSEGGREGGSDSRPERGRRDVGSIQCGGYFVTVSAVWCEMDETESIVRGLMPPLTQTHCELSHVTRDSRHHLTSF